MRCSRPSFVLARACGQQDEWGDGSPHDLAPAPALPHRRLRPAPRPRVARQIHEGPRGRGRGALVTDAGAGCQPGGEPPPRARPTNYSHVHQGHIVRQCILRDSAAPSEALTERGRMCALLSSRRNTSACGAGRTCARLSRAHASPATTSWWSTRRVRAAKKLRPHHPEPYYYSSQVAPRTGFSRLCPRQVSRGSGMNSDGVGSGHCERNWQ